MHFPDKLSIIACYSSSIVYSSHALYSGKIILRVQLSPQIELKICSTKKTRTTDIRIEINGEIETVAGHCPIATT